MAASLDALGKADLAAGAYQRVIANYSDALVLSAAKFALARIDESQGKFSDALVLYQDIATTDSGGSLGSEAGMRLLELRAKVPAPAAPPPPTVTSAPTVAAPLKSGQ